MTFVYLLILAALFGWLGLLRYRRRSFLLRAVPKNFDPVRYGLAPSASLDPRKAGPTLLEDDADERDAVIEAAFKGDWKPAAAYAEGAGQDHDERWSRIQLLQQLADRTPQWLDAWLLAQPNNGDALSAHASLLVHQAWAARGSGYANQLSAQNKAAFKQMLPDAYKAAQRASLAAPEHPGPWVVMITAARGLNTEHDEFQKLWTQLVARAPHHYDGHWQALQYWCAKWHGSRELMLRFATAVVDSAPPGSPLAAIYLHALDELVERSNRVNGTELAHVTSWSADARATLLRAARSLDQVAEDDGRVQRLRHKLAFYLCNARHYDAALEQFRRLGPWCGAEPWTTHANIITTFERARATAALRATAKPA
ncbi:hypothetical protein ACEZCY_36710 [Streptacidiphilus sp. N1-12]|uniref:DUF4034 domain-containing protein n=2 Tax=Streptacidiphilus alkalitolerans TaxID=3342712 RepID=A0ABV6VMD1_9ACTN